MFAEVNDAKEISKIVVHYADGTVEEATTGFLANVEYLWETDIAEITFKVLRVTERDMQSIIQGVLAEANRLGMLDDKKSGDNDEH